MKPEPIAPAALTEIREDWFVMVRDMILRDGRAVRANGCHIEVQRLTVTEHAMRLQPGPLNEWAILALPTGALSFAKAEDCAAVVERFFSACRSTP